MSRRITVSVVLTIALLAIVRAAAVVDPATAGGENVIELYMHDILGGSSPTARPITGLLGNIYSGQVPFARPVGFRPPKGGVAIPNANGVLPTVNGVNGIPLGTGLAGTTFAGTTNGQNQVQTQLGPDGLSLGFGTITVIDDILTSGPDLGSQQLGKAQGVYVASSADGSTQMMAFTAMFEGGEFGDSLNFYGIYQIGSAMSHLTVTGGTGKFKLATGIAELRGLIPSGQQVIDGAETLLRITVHLRTTERSSGQGQNLERQRGGSGASPSRRLTGMQRRLGRAPREWFISGDAPAGRRGWPSGSWTRSW